jgi:hypothetical protein
MSGIEPKTFHLVAQYLNQLRLCVPPLQFKKRSICLNDQKFFSSVSIHVTVTCSLEYYKEELNMRDKMGS